MNRNKKSIAIDLKSERGRGVLEKEVRPGQIAIGTDSHTCMAGALNAFATGVGSTDAGAAMATGQLWFKVPETIKIVLRGGLPPGVFAKDLVLFRIGKLTEDGANYQPVEMSGETISSLSMGSRFTTCNMGVEMGAKASMMEADETTRQWLLRNGGQGQIKPVKPDADAVYSRTLEFQVGQLEPQIAKPHKVDIVVPLKEVAGTSIQEVVIGTCTNGRLEDLEIAATILEGKRIAPDLALVYKRSRAHALASLHPRPRRGRRNSGSGVRGNQSKTRRLCSFDVGTDLRSMLLLFARSASPVRGKG